MKNTKFLLLLSLIVGYAISTPILNKQLLAAELVSNELEKPEVLLECTSSKDCEINKACNPENKKCENCRNLGEVSPNDSLCCGGWLGKNGRCTFECTEEAWNRGYICGGSRGNPSNLEVAETIMGYLLGLISLLSIFSMLISFTIYTYAVIFSKNNKELSFAKKLFHRSSLFLVFSIIIYWFVGFVIHDILNK